MLKDPEVAKETLFGNLRRSIETHGEMTSYLTLLLATLGIMIGLFTVTGFINRMGAMLLDLGAWNVIAMILMAYIFGWLAGAGLPPTATYIIGAVVIVRPCRSSASTRGSRTSSSSCCRSGASYHRRPRSPLRSRRGSPTLRSCKTMWEALKICLPITLMTFAIFTRPNMVVNTGLATDCRHDAGADLTCGITFAMFGRYFERTATDIALRCLLAAVSLFCMFHPDMATSAMAAALVVPAFAVGVWRHRQVAAPKSVSQPAEGPAAPSADLSKLVVEARREIG